MTIKRTLVLAAPALFVLSGLGDKVAFAPQAGLTLTKTFSQKDETTLDDMSMVVNGQEQDSSAMGMEQDISSHIDVVLVDEYEAVADGEPVRLKRKYEQLASGTTMKMSNQVTGEMTVNMTGTSELEGLEVRFVRGEDGEYTAKFVEEGAGDEALLEDLTEDTDLRAFLPTSEVEEGATWEVEPDELRHVLAFGGALKFDMESEDMPDMGGFGGSPDKMPSADQFLGEIDGTITGEYRGTREEEGAKVAVINLTIAVNSAKDMTDFFRESMDEAELPEGMNMQMDYKSVDMEFELEAEGVLLWNLAGGHMHSFEMTGKGSMTMDMAMAMEMEGMGKMELEMCMIMKSDSTLTLSAAAAE
jgi:hypothetical protein